MKVPIEYLVNYGSSGLLGRFVGANGEIFSRGDRVLVQSERGLEAGTIVLAANGSPLQLPFLPVPGTLLRRLSVEDEQRWVDVVRDAHTAFRIARELTTELDLPIEIVDVEAVSEPATF